MEASAPVAVTCLSAVHVAGRISEFERLNNAGAFACVFLQ